MVTVCFQGPDWHPTRYPNPDKSWDGGFSLDVLGFDVDYGMLTVYPPGDEMNINLTLAHRAPYMNEDGEECGDIGWEVWPEAQLLDSMPELEKYVGRRYGRVIVT